MKLKLLLLIQSHKDASLLSNLVPILRDHVEFLRVAYSPVVLVDEAAVSREYDIALRDIEEAMDACYKRRDGAGGDNYRTKYDAMVLEKASKVKNAWKSLTDEAKKEAVNRVFGKFFDAKPCPNMAITEHGDHFEPAAWVELLNSLNSSLKPTPSDFVVTWPTALLRDSSANSQKTSSESSTSAASAEPTLKVRADSPLKNSIGEGRIPMPPKTSSGSSESSGRVTSSPRFKELVGMHIDELGREAIKAGVQPVGNKLKIVHAILKAEKTKAELAAL